jgi:hypothetical protein
MIPGLAVPLQMGVLLLTARGLIIIFGHNPLFDATRIIFLWLATAAKSLDAHSWGGASPAPFPRAPRAFSTGHPMRPFQTNAASFERRMAKYPAFTRAALHSSLKHENTGRAGNNCPPCLRTEY